MPSYQHFTILSAGTERKKEKEEVSGERGSEKHYIFY
jgi:hypothetical protein